MNEWYAYVLKKDEAEKFKRFLKIHGIKYESSQCFDCIHFEVNIVSNNQILLIDHFLKTGKDLETGSLNLATEIKDLIRDIDYYEHMNEESEFISDTQSMLIKNETEEIKSYFKLFLDDNDDNALNERIYNVLHKIESFEKALEETFNFMGKEKWNKYLNYLSKWAIDHKDVTYYGSSPACFDEFVDNEYTYED